MAVALTLQEYLAEQKIAYDLVRHAPTESSAGTSEACHIPSECLAKGVVVRQGHHYVLAVLPASHQIRLSDLQRQLGEEVELARETEVERLFPDCERGAVPPIGTPYGLDTIIDESIQGLPEVYFEAGDHATLVHMTQAQFRRVATEARHGRFSAHS
jgi:Ala-tRNA(Pro) deacylase